MNDEIKEILDFIYNEDNYSNFIDAIYGGKDCYILLSIEEQKKLKYYITNLQQENERLRNHTQMIPYLQTVREKDDYKSRVEKAAEYIKKNKLYNFSYDKEEIFYTVSDKKARNKLLNILQNGSDEE